MKNHALAVMVLAAFAGASTGAEAEDYLTKDGQLRHPLEFRDGQSGFAGVTGTVWRIEADGSWTVSTFRNETVQKTLRRGQLSKKQREALAKHLAALEVTKLPRSMAGFKGANPHTFSLRFGDRTVTVTVAPGQSLSETILVGEEAKAWSRFVAAAAIVQLWTAGGEARE